MGKKHFCFFQIAEAGNRTPDTGVKGSGANHYPKAPALKLSKREKRVYIVPNEYHSTLAPLYIISFLLMIAAHWLESSRLITIPT